MDSAQQEPSKNVKKIIEEILDEKWSSGRIQAWIKEYLRWQFKYGISCPYCGLPGETHKECRAEI